MRKSTLKTVLVVLFLLFSLISLPKVQAITPQNQTISITDTHDDRFITETGIGIDSQLCGILDPNMDIRSFLVFRELDINWWEPLKNATIRLRTTVNLDFDNESSVTIYGMKFSDLQEEGILSSSFVLSVPLTSTSVNVNTSQFYGQQWHEINVTSIVGELISSIHWDGHGLGGTETGDSIGFVILGAEGYDTRWFIDYLYGTPSLAPQLVLHWNHAPQPPSEHPDAVYNSTYRGYHIFNYTINERWINYGDYNYVYVTGGTLTVVDNQTITGVNILPDDSDNFRLVRYRNDEGQAFTNGQHLFGLNITRIEDVSGGSHIAFLGFFYGHSDVNKSVYDIDNDLDDACLFGLESPEDADDNIGIFVIHTHDSGVWNIKRGQEWNITEDSSFGVNCTFDYPNESFYVTIYNDTTFTDVIEYLNRTSYDPINTAYNWGFAFNTESSPLMDTSNFDFNTVSEAEGIEWAVTDENGTLLVDELDTLEDTEVWIDNYDPDPEDPDPGGEWSTGPGGETGAFTRFRMRLWFMLIGFGCLFGPVLFFSWRRPSGYYILCGAIVMLIGIGLLLSIGQV